MDASLSKVEVTAFDAARLKAMQQYSLLEAMLASILAYVLSVNLTKAHIIFYRVVNARSRLGIISDLLAKSSYAETKPYWRSVEKEVLRIDGIRNTIIHWLPIFHHGTIGGLEEPRPKQLLKSATTASELHLTDLEKFIADVKPLCTELMLYGAYLDGSVSDAAQRAAFLEILSKPRDGQTLNALHAAIFPKAP